MPCPKRTPFVPASRIRRQRNAVSIAILLIAAPLQAQAPSTHARSPATTLEIAPDLDKRRARFKPIQMPFHQEGLTSREIALVRKLVDAANYIERIYWWQSDPAGLRLYVSLQGSTKPEDVKLRHLLKINGSRYDLVDEMKPFVGTAPAPPGRALYPPGLTRDDIEKYLQRHPGQKAALYSEFTVV